MELPPENDASLDVLLAELVCAGLLGVVCLALELGRKTDETAGSPKRVHFDQHEQEEPEVTIARVDGEHGCFLSPDTHTKRD